MRFLGVLEKKKRRGNRKEMSSKENKVGDKKAEEALWFLKLI